MTSAFDLHANLIVVDVILEGVTRPFVVDTGASATVVGDELAAELGLPERERVIGRGAGGDVPMRLVGVRSLAVGGMEAHDLNCLVMDLAGLRERIGHRIDGILGYDFLSRFRVIIDYAARVITLVPTGTAPVDRLEDMGTAARRSG